MAAARLALQLQETHLQKQLEAISKSPTTLFIPRSPSGINISGEMASNSPPQSRHTSGPPSRHTSPPQTPLPPLPPTPTDSARSYPRRTPSTKNSRRLSATYEDPRTEDPNLRAETRYMEFPERVGGQYESGESETSPPYGVQTPPQDVPTDQYGRPLPRKSSQQNFRRNDYAYPHLAPEKSGSTHLYEGYDPPNANFSGGEEGNNSDYEDRDISFATPARQYDADLTSWAPADNAVPLVASSIANLPDWSSLGDGGLTSFPNRAIQRDIDYTLRKLLNVQVFEQCVFNSFYIAPCWQLIKHVSVLSDPLGRYRFRDFLVSEGASTAELDMWFDVMYHEHLIEQLRSSAEAIQGTPYLGQKDLY